jgi:hypothetical protein
MTDLGRYHNDTVGALHADEDRNNYEEAAGERYDEVSDLAVDLLFAAQTEGTDSEYIGPAVPDLCDVPVSEDVQTLLTLAMFRYPPLADLLETLVRTDLSKVEPPVIDDMGSVNYKGFTLVPSEIQVHIWDGPKFWNTAHGAPHVALLRAKKMIDDYLNKDK